MNSYRVHWTYHRLTDAGRWTRKPGDVVVVAESAVEACKAFQATHPAGEVFFYSVQEVEALAAGVLFDAI